MSNNYLIYALLPFFISAFSSYFNIKILHLKFDNYIKKPKGPQKIHDDNISRLGGLSIITTITIMSFIHYLYSDIEKDLILLCLLMSIPIFILGFWEDITQTVTPILRIFGSILSSILLISIFELCIKNVGIIEIQSLFNNKLFAFFFTVLCIVYLTQSFNIIDGLNGLSLFTGIIILGSVSIISYKVGDLENFYFAIFFISILLGVLIFNFPGGKIFIGDSGAYLIGLIASLLVLMLVNKNPNLSPFVIVQILIYPTYELFRSICRRLIHKKSIFRPDAGHLHSLLYKYNLSKLKHDHKSINCITSSQIIFFNIINVVYLINFYNFEKIVILGIFVFVITYEIIYYKIRNYLKQPL